MTSIAVAEQSNEAVVPSTMHARKKAASVRRRVRSKRRRPRKRHEQVAMLNAEGTKVKSRKGGARKGAGRPPKGPRAGAPHKKREAFRHDKPLHVVIGVVPELPTLRSEAIFDAIREATRVAARYGEIRIIHMSIQWNHIHLIVESKDKVALARGMKSFEVSAAKRINRVLERKGQVFRDRYHVEILKSPTQTYRAINYVLNNFRHHGEDKQHGASKWKVDRYSTGVLFDAWTERVGRGRWPLPSGYQPLVVQAPRTWLLSVGWRKISTTISCFSVPGPVHGKKAASKR